MNETSKKASQSGAYASILLAAALWGIIGLWNRTLMAAGLSPTSIVTVRNFGGMAVLLAVFAVRSAALCRSSFYVIGAVSAVSILLMQTILNVFGTVDILPLTGVTFPFLSNGGTSMIAAWGLLAFLKSADTRQNASFAIRLPGRKQI